MTTYDPKTIEQFANGLYRRAAGIIALGLILGALVGDGLGFGLGSDPASPDTKWIGAISGAVIVGALGFFAARNTAAQLQIQAQLALCQMKIEENKRPAPSASLHASRVGLGRKSERHSL